MACKSKLLDLQSSFMSFVRDVSVRSINCAPLQAIMRMILCCSVLTSATALCRNYTAHLLPMLEFACNALHMCLLFNRLDLTSECMLRHAHTMVSIARCVCRPNS